jgi:hypothetical protein
MQRNNQNVSIDVILSADNPIEVIKKLNAQIYPAKYRITTNDKLSKVIFGLSEAAFASMDNGQVKSLVEKKNHKKHGKIKSPFRVYTGEGVTNKEPLNQFDRAVHDVIVSNWYAGNRYITPGIIYRGITGKVNYATCDARPSDSQRTKIMHSVEKLMTTLVSSDMTDVCKNLKYNDGKPFTFCSAVIPACYVDATINGQDATVIFLDREPPLFTVAKLKKQLLTFDADLLDVANQQNTAMNVELKNYSLIRVEEVELHKMTPTLTFDDIFEKCNIKDKSRKTKMDARNVIIDLFQHLKDVGKIDSFEIVKSGNSFSKITFTYSKNISVAPIAQDNNKTDSSPDDKADTQISNTNTTDTGKEKTPAISPATNGVLTGRGKIVTLQGKNSNVAGEK